METDGLRQEIDALMAELGEDASIARPAAERAVVEKIRRMLDQTRDQRTSTARADWESYLPYAARLCQRLARLEEGWENDLEYFASENAQFWLDNAAARLEEGDLSAVRDALGQIVAAAGLVRQDMIFRAVILLDALEIALEITDKKHAIQIFDAAEKVYRKHLTGGEQYTGSAWLAKIKKIGQQLARQREKLRRYFQHSDAIIFSIEADSEAELERVIETLQLNLSGKIKVTRGVKAADGPGQPRGFRARLKITLD